MEVCIYEPTRSFHEITFVSEIGNSHDQDHCCRILVENGSYEFEGVDG